MAAPKSKQRITKTSPKEIGLKDIELVPDAWPKFEGLIKSAAKMGHKPHVHPEEGAPSRVRKG
jgi:hypothetical protein